MRIRRLLMCKPTYFDIDYVINPWMDLATRVDKMKAEDQWANLVATLEDLDVQISYIDPQPGLADMTFSGDAGMVRGQKFVVSNFRHPQRQPESHYYEAWMRNHGYETLRIPQGIHFEGLGDILHWGDSILFGYGPRSDKRAIDHIKALLPDLQVLGELHIKDPDFFHLALAACLIDHESILYYAEAFTDESRRFLNTRFPNAIPVSGLDAKDYFVCNNISINHNLLVDNCSTSVERQLEKAGFQVIKCDMSEFKKSGGSLRCLVLNLD
jgi:N-dimethylarginine dimethylaminohydrolase